MPRYLKLLIRFLLTSGSLFYLVYIGIYGDSYKTWNLLVAIPLTIIAILINIIAANYDVFPILKELAETKIVLKNIKDEYEDFKIVQSAESNELKSLIIKFIDKGLFYTEKLKYLLKQYNDYVCVIKSSEGLSEVWKELEKEKWIVCFHLPLFYII